MSSLQIRNVPDEVLRVLKARAAAAGQSLSEYALVELTARVSHPTIAELTERIRLRGAVDAGAPAADVLREERPGDAA